MTETSAAPEVYRHRISSVREQMRSRNIDCLLVSCPENVRYLVGFAGSSGWVLVTINDVVLATDARYLERVHLEQPWLTTDLVTGTFVDFVGAYMTLLDVRSLGVEGDHIPYIRVEGIKASVCERAANCSVESTEGIIEALRMVKDDAEILPIRSAATLADAALSYAIEVVRPGMAERTLAWLIERWLREHGSEAVPFPVIVASGANSSLPHALSSERPILEGEPVVIDLGARVDGYCSDLTRTLFLGHMGGQFQEMYSTVLSAQESAVVGVRTGMSGAEADELARSVIRESRFDGFFTHGLGHGVGLEIHERPTLNARSSDVLVDNMVFTIEPGVYVPGLGGVRIEDTVVLRDGLAHALGQFDKRNPVVISRGMA